MRKFETGGATTPTTPTDPSTNAPVGKESSLSNWAGPYVTEMLGQGQALANSPYEAYQGTLTAGPTALQSDAFQGIAGLTLPDAYDEAANTISDVNSDLGNLNYDPTTFTNNFSPTEFTDDFQASGYTDRFDPTQFTDGYQATDYVDQYDPTQFTNDFQANEFSANYNPTEFTNAYGDPTQFSNSYNGAGSDGGAGFNTDAYDGPTDFNTDMWIDPGFSDAYMSPYVEQALNPQLEEMRRQAQITQLQNNARYTKAGAYGGSRQAIADSEQQDNMTRLMAELTGKGYSDAYESGGRMFTSDEARDLQAQKYGDTSRQFGAGFDMEAQRNNEMASQFAAGNDLRTQQASEQAKQFGAGQDFRTQQATDASNQFASLRDMDAQKASEASRQFGSNRDFQTQQATDASSQFSAQNYLRNLQAGDASRQFGAGQDLRTQQAGDASRQFGANYGLQSQQAADASNQFGAGNTLRAQQARDASNQFGAGNDLRTQQADEASSQFGANYGLESLVRQMQGAETQGRIGEQDLRGQRDILSDQMGAGSMQRAIESEGIMADQAQFMEERDYPYKQVQYMQSLLQGMPLAAQNYSYAEPSWLSDFGSSAGGILDLIKKAQTTT